MVDNGGQLSLASLLGLAVTMIASLFGFTHVRVKQVRDELSADIDAMKTDLARQAGEFRQNNQQLWSQLNVNETRANDYRARVERKLGELPTRDDMKSARDEMRQDLKAMEDRIMVRDNHKS